VSRRTAAFLVASVTVLSVLQLMVWQKQRIVNSGRTVLLEIVPVDPRSLMAGDYLRLSWRLERDLHDRKELARSGTVVVKVDSDQRARFERIDTQARAAGEQLLRYRVVGSDTVRIGPDAFYFQEGQADAYRGARYGELRCDQSGNVILVGLRDERLRPLHP
jgi:uncharacterized membrane-anchored protein